MSWIDKIHLGDARELAGVPDQSVDLVCTSPPYNLRKQYGKHSDDLPMDEYLAFMQASWEACYRVLKDGGRLAINIIGGAYRKPYLPVADLVKRSVEASAPWLARGEIVWWKGALDNSTAWGSFASPSNPCLRDVHEYIFVYSRGRLGGPGRPAGARADITSEEFMDWTKSVWHFPPAFASRKGHPAPFPPELPRRLIKLYTFPGAVVLDCFAGSGTTCREAKRLGRHFVGFDNEPKWVAMADAACAQEVLPMAQPEQAPPREKLVQLALPGLAGKRQLRTAGVV